jgi:hypothetical protein
MKTLSARLVLFNAAAILVSVAAIVGVVRSYLVTRSMGPCTERYATRMVFPLQRDGVILTATDIQARAGGRDGGLLENLEIVPLEKGPAPVAMSVSMPKGSAAPNSSMIRAGGISFPWQPRSVRDQPAVCLSYSIQLPADFDFNLGGMLPGLLGRTEQSGDQFLVQSAWRQDGIVGATNAVTLDGKSWKQTVASEGPAFARGRWVWVDQEVVLNAPDRENGVLRLWVDGALAIDRSDFVYRTKSDVGITGVAGDVFYGGQEVGSRSPADTKVLLSPFEIRWK